MTFLFFNEHDKLVHVCYSAEAAVEYRTANPGLEMEIDYEKLIPEND